MELEQVALEMKRLETERIDINSELEQRNREWAELNNCIEDLKVQSERLKKQRELLHADREEILSQIEDLKKLRDLKVASDSIVVAELQKSDSKPSQQKTSAKRILQQQTPIQKAEDSHKETDITDVCSGLNSPSMGDMDGASMQNSAHYSWIKHCTELIFKRSPDKTPVKYEERCLSSDHENA